MPLKSQYDYWFGKELKAYDHESLTVTNAVKTLTSAKLNVSGYEKAVRVYITVEGDSIRYRLDGGDPSSTVGHLAYTGEAIEIEGKTNLERFKTIRVTTDATLHVTYQRYE